MKKRIKEIIKRVAEVLRSGAYIKFSDYTDKWFFHEGKRKK
jgi:hypothetical protein